jgi:hypothetical protein
MSGSRSPLRPGSPESPSSTKAQSPEPAKGSRYKLALNESSIFKRPLPHSASMPNLDSDDSELSPKQSITRPQSPVEQSSRMRSPESPSSPASGRHSLLSSPILEPKHPHKTLDAATYRFYLIASIEDAIRSSMSDEYCLAKFSYIEPQGYSDPAGRFHCVIHTIAGEEVFNEQYHILKLSSIEKFVEAFNRDCKLFAINAEQVIRGCDQNKFILSALNPGPGNAVFIVGEDEVLGDWTHSHRMNWSDAHFAWRYTPPADMTKGSYKHQLGSFAAGKNPESHTLKWEEYPGNRQLLPLQLQQKTPRMGK